MAVENRANIVIGIVFAVAVVGAMLLGRRGAEPDPVIPTGGQSTPAAAVPSPAVVSGQGAAPELKNDSLIAAAQAIQEQKWDDAIELLRKVPAGDPEHGLAQHNLGIVYEKAGDFPAARDTFRKLTAMVPQQADGWINLGWAEYLNGNYQAAEKATLRGIEIDAGFSPQARFNLGLYRAAGGATADALETYSRALDYERLRPPTERGTGTLQGLDDLRQFADKNPDNATVHFAMASLYQSLQEPAWVAYEIERYLALVGEREPDIRKQAEGFLTTARIQAAALPPGSSRMPPPPATGD